MPIKLWYGPAVVLAMLLCCCVFTLMGVLVASDAPDDSAKDAAAKAEGDQGKGRIALRINQENGTPIVIVGDKNYSMILYAAEASVGIADVQTGKPIEGTKLLRKSHEFSENSVSGTAVWGVEENELIERVTELTITSEQEFRLEIKYINHGKESYLCPVIPLLRLQNQPQDENKGRYTYGLDDFYGLIYTSFGGYYHKSVWTDMSYTFTAERPLRVEPWGHPVCRMTQISTRHLPFILQPGGQQAYVINVKVGGGSTEDPEFAKTAEEEILGMLRQDAEKFPVILNWPDRRPILMWNPLADLFGGYNTNPRGYRSKWGSPFEWRPDTTTPEGMKAFREILLHNARVHIEQCATANAQGVILWDLEGQEDPHAITYLGSPDRLILHAPELDALIDEVYAMLFESGIRAGLTIRPQEVKLREGRDPDWPLSWKRAMPKYSQDGNPRTAVFGTGGLLDEDKMIAHLSDKIGYAYDRWKVTIFYIDSPGGITPRVMYELGKKYPDCLFIPEFPVTWYYPAAAPLHLWRSYNRAKSVWPDAFGCGFGVRLHAATPEELATHTGYIKDGNIPVYEGNAAIIGKIIAEHGTPKYHDPATFIWNDNQPVSREINRRLLELRNASADK